MKNSRLAKLIGIGILVIGMSGSVFGQQHTENKADQTLRGSGRVNPSTLGMEFDLPLGSYSGRGINVPIGLSYSSKVWRMDSIGSFPIPVSGGPPRCVNVNEARFGENSASGWTTSMQEAYIEYTGYDSRFNGVGYAVSNEIGCIPEGGNNGDPGATYIKRIQIHLQSGESHEFRMDDTPVAFSNQSITPTHPDYDANWNGWYYAVDGSNLRYFEDRTNNVYKLHLPDGSYYEFGTKAPNSNYNFKTIRTATKFYDRNGNFTTYHEPTTLFPNGYWTDTLGRNLSVPLPRKAPDVTGIQDYLMTGMSGGNPITYRFHWKKLKGEDAANSGLTNFNQTPQYTASNNSPPGMFAQPPRSEITLFRTTWHAWVVDTYTIENVPAIFNPILLTAIELPNGQIYRFSYNIYGEIDKIIYPTGGKEIFIHDKVPPLTYPAIGSALNNQANRGVTNRKVFENDNAIPLETNYNAEYVSSNGFQIGYKVTTNNPDLTRTERIVNQGKRNINNQTNGDWGFDKVIAGMAYDESSFSSTGQMTSKKLTYWTSDYVLINGTNEKAERNPRVTKEESIIYDNLGNGISTTSTIEYEGDLNQRETPLLAKKTSQYKFVPAGSPLPALPERTSETQYLQSDPNILQTTKDAYKAQNMVGLATNSVVKDASGIIVSRSEMLYDESVYSPNIGRGNPTTSRVWDSTKGNHDNPNAYIATHAKFDIYGNQTESTDAKGNVSTTEYSALYNYAFPTKVTTPIPSDGVNGSNTAFITTVVYDPTTGLPTSTTDANGLETRIEYDPTTLRPIRTKNYYQNSQVGGTSETIFNDTPGSISVKSRTQIDATNWAENITYSDGLGRAFKSEKLDSGGSIFTETEFDSVGRPKRSTNPYRANEAKVWTTTNYDVQGRPFEIVTVDGAKVTTSFGLSTTGTHIGTTVTVTDQANKQRRSITNALGQLTRVDEPDNNGNLGTLTSPTQPTNYNYDSIGNLVKVSQGIQNRFFKYDSLGRLIRVRQPEQATNPSLTLSDSITGNNDWSSGSTYDLSGNILANTDAKNVVTSYVYDNLNRPLTRTYNDGTPNVNYQYDNGNTSFSKGKLTKVSNSISTTEYTAFDNLGKILSHKQTIDGNSYTTAYGYNLSGALISETYPSGRTVKNTLDNDGNLAIVESQKLNQVSKTYANGFKYTSAGALSSLRLGNGRFESTQFNSRLQPIQIGLGTSAATQNLLKLNYDFGGSDNNGNVKSQTINTGTATFIQTYQYDSLNRLTEAKEVSNGNQAWKQNFGFDRFGNRTNISEYIGNSLTNSQTPQVDATNNRFTTASGFVYDLNGNVVMDNQSRRFEYDAENRQKEVRDTNNVLTAKYVCDGNGNRVKKVVIASGETTIFVYDANSKLIAEYSTQILQNPQVQYLTNDTLGSPRILTDDFGKIISRRDFRPFGEEVFADGNVRTINQKYGINDEIDQKFSGKERDTETGLDYFLARYYANQHGRFTSTDPIIMAKERLFDPQQINLYGYARNNPLKYIDPNGEQIKVTGSAEDQKRYVDDLNKRLKDTGLQVKIDKKGYVQVDGKTPDKLKDSGAKLLLGAINNEKTANIGLVQNDGQVDFGTPFGKDGNIGSQQTIDYGDLKVLNDAKIDGYDSSNVAYHETIEAIQIQLAGKDFETAHGQANSIAPGLVNGDLISGIDNGRVVYQARDYTVAGSKGSIAFAVVSVFAKQPTVKEYDSSKDKFKFRASYPLNITAIAKGKTADYK